MQAKHNSIVGTTCAEKPFATNRAKGSPKNGRDYKLKMDFKRRIHKNAHKYC
jgi:hypothetical protein